MNKKDTKKQRVVYYGNGIIRYMPMPSGKDDLYIKRLNKVWK